MQGCCWTVQVGDPRRQRGRREYTERRARGAEGLDEQRPCASLARLPGSRRIGGGETSKRQEAMPTDAQAEADLA
jgi:hypothetical protein